MTKQEYNEKLNIYIKEDEGGNLFIDERAVKNDAGEEILDQEIPVTEKEHLGFSIKVNKKRYTEFPNRLPADTLPRPVDEHSRMGLYESKRDLYLMIAGAYNKAMERIEQLEAELEILKKG